MSRCFLRYRTPMLRRCCIALLFSSLLSVSSSRVNAQSHAGDSSDWIGEAELIGGNVIVGGVIGVIASAIRGAPVVRGLVRGALGGGVSYAGKRLLAREGFSGAGLLGRQMTAVGASIVRSASRGGGVLDSIALAAGPLRAVVSTPRIHVGSVRVDLWEAYWLLYGLIDPRLTLDMSQSLSSGTPVFRTNHSLAHRGNAVNGLVVGGAVVLSSWTDEDPDIVLAHERTHVLQHDFLKFAIGYELEDWVKATAGVENHWSDLFLIGLGFKVVQYPLDAWFDRSSNILEIEAEFLERR